MLGPRGAGMSKSPPIVTEIGVGGSSDDAIETIVGLAGIGRCSNFGPINGAVQLERGGKTIGPWGCELARLW